jgi:hypothetical protein
MMPEQDTIFLLQDVNKKMPLLKRITQSIVDTWQEIITERQELEVLGRQVENKPKDEGLQAKFNEAKDSLNCLIDKINGYIKEIESLGGFVEEFKRGIINFKVIIYKRVVFVCCRPLEEDSFTHFHDVDEIYADKKPIPDKVR